MNKNQHIPQGYKSSPLGIIPEDWEVKRLGEISKLYSGGTTKSGNPLYYNGTIPFIRSGEISQNKTELFLTQNGIDNSSAKYVEKSDILYALYGANSGQCALSKINGVINQAILCIRPKADRYYVMAFLQLNKDHYYNAFLQGGQGNLSGEIVSNYNIAIPPLPEQQRIVSVLQLWDTAISKQTQLVEKLTLRKRGLMQQLLTGKKRLKGFEGEWKEVKLGEIATFFSGGTPKSSNKSYYNGDIPFIRSGEIDKNKTELFISQEGINNSSAKIVEKGDILYALYGATSGQCSMSKIQGAINQAILCIRPNANRYFIMSILQLNKENYYNSYLQGGQGNLSGEIVSNYIISIPTNDEQNAIASVLIQADKGIELANKKLTQLQAQKRGLMQVLLTGKKRVR